MVEIKSPDQHRHLTPQEEAEQQRLISNNPEFHVPEANVPSAPVDGQSAEAVQAPTPGVVDASPASLDAVLSGAPTEAAVVGSVDDKMHADHVMGNSDVDDPAAAVESLMK